MLDKSTSRFINELITFSEKFKFHEPKGKNNDLNTPKISNRLLLDGSLNNDLKTIPNMKKHGNTKLQNHQEISLKICSRGQPTCVKVISDDSVAIGFTTGEVVIFDLRNFKPEYGFNELNSPVCCLETIYTPNRYLICGGGNSDPSLIIWDFDKSRGIRKLTGHKD